MAVVAPMAAQVALGEALGTARPAGGDADGPVPEARPGQVEARLADRRLLRHHRLDSHRAGIRVGQGRRRPLSALAAEATAVPAHAEEPKAVGGMRGHEGAIDEARSAAEPLEAPELPAARHLVRFQPHPRAIRGPDGHGAHRCVHAAGLGADGNGVGMSLDQAGEGQVLGRDLGQPLEALPGAAAARRGPRRATGGDEVPEARVCGLLCAEPTRRRRHDASPSATSVSANPPRARPTGRPLVITRSQRSDKHLHPRARIAFHKPWSSARSMAGQPPASR